MLDQSIRIGCIVVILLLIAIPLQAHSITGVEAPRISRQSAHEGGKVVSPLHWLPLPPGDTPGTHFC